MREQNRACSYIALCGSKKYKMHSLMMRNDGRLWAALDNMLPVGLTEVTGCYAGDSKAHLRANICMRHEEERGMTDI